LKISISSCETWGAWAFAVESLTAKQKAAAQRNAAIVLDIDIRLRFFSENRKLVIFGP
jgi:hypothetical protein